MNRTGQKGKSPYNTQGYGASTFDNNAPGSAMSGGLPPVNTDLMMGFPLNAAPTLKESDVASKIDYEGSGSTMMDPSMPNKACFNMGSQNGSSDGACFVPARGIQATHPVVPSRGTPMRGETTQRPYARPKSNSVRPQFQAQRRLFRRTPARHTAMQKATNAYTLPRTRPNTVQPQDQRDLAHGIMPIPATDHMARSSGSVSPFNPSDLNILGAASSPFSTDQASGFGGVTTAPADTIFVRPVRHNLDSSRIDPAGPEPHPDPNWRAPGPHQWSEILHDHTILQYLSDATIKDLLKHCDGLAESGVQDPSNPTGPALVEGGPYTVLDAQTVWNYCTAYSKRRQQHRNNHAASRSRNNKAAQLKHWKALALAAGAPDRDFIFDINDAGNAPSAPATLLAAVTQTAIHDMKNTWASAIGVGNLALMPTLPFASLIPDEASQPLSHSQIQQQIYGQPQHIARAPRAEVPQEHCTNARDTVMTPRVVATAKFASGLPTYTAVSPPTTTPHALIGSAATDISSSNDIFEQFKLDMGPVDEDLLKDFTAENNHDTHNGGFDFGGGEL